MHVSVSVYTALYCSLLYCPLLAHTVFLRQREFCLFSVIQQHVCLHMQASLKKFMDYIQTSAVDKMVKFIDKGLDPNYQDSDTGGKEHHLSPPLWHLAFSSFCLSSLHTSRRLHLYCTYLKAHQNTSKSSHSWDENLNKTLKSVLEVTVNQCRDVWTGVIL